MECNLNIQRRGRFENLEQRNLLAGDVMVSVHGDGHVKIEGDDADNQILITAGAEAGSFVVMGLDGTTVTFNGTTGAEATIDAGSRFKIDLGDGNDLAAVVGVDIDGKVDIRTGEGDDRALLGTSEGADELDGVTLPTDLSVNVSGKVSINTDGGDDLIDVEGANLDGKLSLRAGDGDDTISLSATVLGEVDDSNGSDSNSNAGFLNSRGNGLGQLLNFGRHFGARAGADINLGDGNDTLNLDDVSAEGKLSVRLGDGDDSVTANAVTSAALSVLGGDGLDSITLTALETAHVGIHTGDDNDTVSISDSVFTSLGVSLGNGDDTLTTENLEARLVGLLGGDGEDTLNQLTDDDFVRELIRGFELPTPVNVADLPFRKLGRILRR